MNRTYIVTWVGADSNSYDWMPCYSREDADRTYKSKVEQGCYAVSLCEVLQSTAFFYPPEVTQ